MNQPIRPAVLDDDEYLDGVRREYFKKGYPTELIEINIERFKREITEFVNSDRYDRSTEHHIAEVEGTRQLLAFFRQKAM